VVDIVDRWVADDITELWERFESAWSERSSECEVWERETGSVVVREARGSVESRARYVVVVGDEGGGARGDGVAK